jgi:U3 small nucleolar RNA-associated protein 20
MLGPPATAFATSRGFHFRNSDLELFLRALEFLFAFTKTSAHVDMERKKENRRLKAAAPKVHSTPSSRRHHFEPFTQRIARLKIDPIRRQRNRDDEYDSPDATSHFRTALDRWKDVNQSDDFTTFARKVDSLCDSLPQVLHHQERIVCLLLEYLRKGITVAAEPLLDLIPRLAQDVQAQFEPHFKETVETVSKLAAEHQDVEVVEWSFHCLTWLFKYLERLLVSDLRPLYQILAPLLGKRRQKEHVTRFAAESLSFLVKKTSKKQESLSALVKLVLEDLSQTSQKQACTLYEQGIFTLFLETIKGVGKHLHSKADVVFGELLSQVIILNDADADFARPAVRVVRAVLAQAVHHAREETFRPILAVVIAQARIEDTTPSNARLVLSAQLLLFVTGIRSGTRVSDWPAVLQTLGSFISFISSQADRNSYSEASKEVLAAFAVAHQASSLDVAISYTQLFDQLCSTDWQDMFLGFCALYSELGDDRFRSLLLPHFQRLVLRSIRLVGTVANSITDFWRITGMDHDTDFAFCFQSS